MIPVTIFHTHLPPQPTNVISHVTTIVWYYYYQMNIAHKALYSVTTQHQYIVNT